MSSNLFNDVGKNNQDQVRMLLITSGFLFAATAIAYVATIQWSWPIPRDATTLVVGRDLLNFWMYGQAALTAEPGRFYDPHLYNHALDALLGVDYPGQNWSYPPSIMLFAVPFGQLGYMQALLCWTVLSVALFVWVAGRYVSDRRLLIPLVLSPAGIFCLMSGQSSFVTAAMMITAFAWLDRKPIAAGILIGLLTLKPQLGLLFPIILIASARWRVFTSAAVTTLALVAVTAALFGTQVWIDFVEKGIPIDHLVLLDPQRVRTPFEPTIFMNLRGLDVGHELAMAVQGIFSLFAVGAVAWAFRYRRHADPFVLAALFFASSICAVPYMLSYDVLAATFAAAILLVTDQLDARGRVLAKLMYWLPVIQLALGQFKIPGPALIPVAFMVYALMRLKDVSDWGRPVPEWRASWRWQSPQPSPQRDGTPAPVGAPIAEAGAKV